MQLCLEAWCIIDNSLDITTVKHILRFATVCAKRQRQ